MEGSDDLNPSKKRPRPGFSVEELQRMVQEKSKEAKTATHRFKLMADENTKLRKIVEQLICRIKQNDESEMSASEEEEIVQPAASPRKVDVNTNVHSKSRGSTEGTRAALAGGRKTAGNEKAKEGESRGKSMPVITTYDLDAKEIMKVIEEKLEHTNYNIKVIGKNIVNISVCTLKDFEEVKGLLEARKVSFYTYTSKGLRPFTIVVEGLPHSFESGEILEYLSGLQINIKVIGLSKLGSDKWVVRLSRASEMAKLYAVRYILRCRVFIRKFVRKGVTQCFNCQRFGHVSSNCRMPYRCVKCGASHGPAKCTVPPRGQNNVETLVTDPVTGGVSKRFGVPVKCVNCDVEGHAASSKECPRRIELLRRLVERKNCGSGPGMRFSATGKGGLARGVSYAAAASAAVVGGRPVTAPRGERPGLVGVSRADVFLGSAVAQYGLVDRDCRRFFGGGLMECLGKMGIFSREYRELDKDEDRSRALLGMLMTLGHNG